MVACEGQSEQSKGKRRLLNLVAWGASQSRCAQTDTPSLTWPPVSGGWCMALDLPHLQEAGVVCASGSAGYMQEEEHSGCIHVRACCNAAMLPLKGIHQAAAACSYVTPSATMGHCWTVLVSRSDKLQLRQAHLQQNLQRLQHRSRGGVHRSAHRPQWQQMCAAAQSASCLKREQCTGDLSQQQPTA